MVERGFPSGQRGGTQDPVAQASEGSNPSPRTFSSSPQKFEEYLKEKQYRESTIETKRKLVGFLRKRVNLWDSEAVRDFIRKHPWGGKRKNNAQYAYRNWCQWKGFEYEYDKFREEDSPLPYIPTERELDQLIAGCNRKYAAFLQLLKETAFRPIEANRLTVDDIDLERRIITLNAPAKRSKPRQVKVSEKLVSMLTPLTKKKGLDESLWGVSSKSMRSTFSNRRKALAGKLGNPRLMKIKLKTFRHWKATMEYHRTKDILYVKELLGHKNIQNTLVYTHLVSFEEDDAWVVKVASSIEEYVALLESGFEYVSDYEGRKVLRKRK